MDHTKLLHGYLASITRADLENILKHDQECLQQMLNGNNSAQLQAQAGFYAAVDNAIKNLPQHSLIWINKIIESELTA
jgi:hypothetical protein